MHTLTQERVKELLEYNPITGGFVWKKNRGGKAKAGTLAGNTHPNGYLFIRVDSTKRAAHRMAFLYMTGEFPEVVDHINGDPGDNRWANLRSATRSQNQWNQKISKHNTSGVKGVHWCKRTRKWIAKMLVGGKTILVGYFPDLIGAELALRKKRNEIHGEFSRHV